MSLQWGKKKQFLNHSCFILYENFLLSFTKSLQQSEDNGTDMLINLHLLIGDDGERSAVTYGHPLCLLSSNPMQMTPDITINPYNSTLTSLLSYSLLPVVYAGGDRLAVLPSWEFTASFSAKVAIKQSTAFFDPSLRSADTCSPSDWRVIVWCHLWFFTWAGRSQRSWLTLGF